MFEENEGTMLTAWYDDGDEWRLYFAVLTTAVWEEDRIKPTDKTRVTVQRIPPERVRSLVSDSEISLSVDEEADLEFKSSADTRLKYRTSEQMENWGHEFPSLCFEKWTDNNHTLEEEDEDALLDTLGSNFGIELGERTEYIGNVIGIAQDHRCRVTFNESTKELLDKQYDDSTELTEDELLSLAESWSVILNGVETDEIDLSLRREESGKLLYETSIPLTEENELSRNSVITAARNKEKISIVTIRAEDYVSYYQLPSIDAPGASDELLRVSKDGVLIDERGYPVVREIELEVNIKEQSADSNSKPPTLFDKDSNSVGRREWYRYIEEGSSENLETLVVSEDEDYDEAMEIIEKALTGTVKLSEPYLRPDFVEDLVRKGSDDLDLWVVLGHDKGYMDRPDFKSKIELANKLGKSLQYLWIPKGSNSPLHDRFLLNKNRGLTIGTSLNSLDSNLTVITEIEDDYAHELEREFDNWWTNTRLRNKLNAEVIDTA
jgi:hypothetical protein